MSVDRAVTLGKEGLNVLFNDAFNTYFTVMWRRTYGKWHIVG